MEYGWKTTVALIAGATAKEVVVSTMGVLFVGEDDSEMISERLTTPSSLTGEPPFTPAKAISFMVFVLLYVPCIATLTRVPDLSDRYPLLIEEFRRFRMTFLKRKN